MNLHAAAGDTWGIAGPTFLTGYLTVAAVLVLASVLARRRLFAGPDAPGGGRLDAQQAAYLHDGPRLALYTALGRLRAAGAVESGPGRSLVAAGQLPAGATPLETAVYNAAGRQLRAGALLGDRWVTEALQALREQLESAGLTLSTQHRRRARGWALALLALAGLGVARVVAGLANDRPVGYLIAAVAVLAVVGAVQLMLIPPATRAGKAALERMRREHHHLSPEQSPSYATYGSDDTAMGVALYGTASLYALDPAFAADMRIQGTTTAGGGSSGSSGGYGGSDGGGSGGDGGGGGGGGGCGG